ncbi:MAG: isoprenylcysteine carboxylmethyltransferase family protein [Thermosynechococcaceae cyanobacterium MS004]|nr:isoprenylcysteine carboxylmethyltransferase family protein [Thermosynechococcaceae cyanobacterium MS004]
MGIFEQWGWSWTNWHKGERGEYWFLGQIAILIIFALLPIHPILEKTVLSPSIQTGLLVMAGVVEAGAIVLVGKGLLDLGRSLTPLPYPREDGELVMTGVYGIVRHPLYGGIILGATGLVIFTLSWLHFLGLLSIILLLDRKATLEEKWLEQKYPGYDAYRSQVKKLIPWVW